MRKLDHLFFDLDNTLWDFDTNSRLAMMETVSQLHLSSQIDDFDSFFEVYHTINTNLWEAYRKQEIRKPELVKKRFEDTLTHFNIQGINPLGMNELYLKLMPFQTRLLPGVIETLEYLKKKGYQLHIITNGFAEVQHRKIESSGLQPYFNRIFISEEIHAPKPDRKIFEHALTSCNAKKSKSLMIGDSWETDIVGARNFGISQVFVKNNILSNPSTPSNTGGQNDFSIKIQNTPPVSTYAINKLLDLTKLL